jgi:hypothetical protein
MEPKSVPEKRFSTGTISVTIWKNEGTSKITGKSTEYRTVSLQRCYTDKHGTWKSTNSLRINDLPKAALVLNKAYEYLVLKQQDSEKAIDIEEIE